MAGLPGAGKTESSKELLAELESKEPKARILRIDPDDLRCEFPSYTGRNSYLFQGAISIVVGRILDLACQQARNTDQLPASNFDQGWVGRWFADSPVSDFI
jgi:UDP-N-acetylglucosamine kinase